MVPHGCTPRARRALSGWAHVSYCTFTGQQCNAQRPLSSARPQLSTALQLRRRWLRRRCGCKPPRVRATCAARARASQSTSAHTSPSLDGAPRRFRSPAWSKPGGGLGSWEHGSQTIDLYSSINGRDAGDSRCTSRHKKPRQWKITLGFPWDPTRTKPAVARSR